MIRWKLCCCVQYQELTERINEGRRADDECDESACSILPQVIVLSRFYSTILPSVFPLHFSPATVSSHAQFRLASCLLPLLDERYEAIDQVHGFTLQPCSTVLKVCPPNLPSSRRAFFVLQPLTLVSTVLTSRKYGVATVWLVATLGSKSNLKKVTRKAIIDVDVQKACETICEPEAPLALRLQSNLL
nr:meiotic recombination protein rec8 [Quercus suber]